MEIILVLIPVTLVIVGVAVATFFWAVDDGQYDDVERRGRETLFGEDDTPARGLDVKPPTAT
jgi:cbb3-type cytochrome oxidase maturation protein